MSKVIVYYKVQRKSSEMSKLNHIFAKRLREARERRGLTQSDLAERLGIVTPGVSHMETARRGTSMQGLAVLADELGVSIDFLLGRDKAEGVHSQEIMKLAELADGLSRDDISLLLVMAKEMKKRR